MEAKEIHEILIQHLPGCVREFRTTTADPFWVVESERIREVAAFLKDHPALQFDMLQAVTGVDRGECFEAVYHLTSLRFGHSVTLKAVLSHEAPSIATISDIYPAANWHERETYDLLGIVFTGHPDLRRILLPDDWEGHPLRKDYVAPESYHGISNAPD